MQSIKIWIKNFFHKFEKSQIQKAKLYVRDKRHYL